MNIIDEASNEERELKGLLKASVNYLELWNDIKEFMESNIELTDDSEYDVLTAWVFASWFMEQWDTYPYIYFYGVHKTGKTRAQDTLMLLACNPKSSCNQTIAVLFYELNKDYPSTLFIDELSMSGKIDDEKRREMLQILNAGYKKGAKVKRMQIIGKKRELLTFKVGGFKCFGSTFTLPDTLRSRCLTIRMRKTRKFFPIQIDKKQAEKLKYRLLAWKKQIEKTYEVTEEIQRKLFEKSGYDGRLVEVFAPLYMVTPEQVKPILLEYLHDLGETEIQEQLASWECEVFTAILNTSLQSSWFATKDVTNIFNENKSDKEKVKSRTIGRQIKQFGFKPHRSNKQRGYKWNSKLVEKLKERYPVEASIQQHLLTEEEIEETPKFVKGD